jgi:hypothetical protein
MTLVELPVELLLNMMRKIRLLAKMVVFARMPLRAQQGLNPTWVLHARIGQRKAHQKMREIETRYVHQIPCCDYFVGWPWKMQAGAYAPDWPFHGLGRPDSMV